MNIINNITQAQTSKKTEEHYELCIQHFTLFHVLNNIMYQEFLKTTDIMEEQNLVRFQAKKSMNRCLALYAKYTDFMSDHLPAEKWYLDQDYARIAYEEIEMKINHLYVAVYNLLVRKGIPRVKVLSRSLCVVYMLKVISSTWYLYFKTYETMSGIDFSRQFAYANMDAFAKEYEKMHYELFSVSTQDIYVMDDPACRAAITALRNHIKDEDYFDKAAYKAIQLNPQISADYEEAIAKIEREKQQAEADVIAEQLSKKFNVKRT